jgi:RNA polymerase sigma factor for flagellar operon FliA
MTAAVATSDSGRVRAAGARVGSGPGAGAAVEEPRRSGLLRTPDMTEVWRAFKATGARHLRDRLIEHYLYLVKVIGNRIAARLPRSIDVQDLRSAGVFGLMRAVENFDLERGTPFESYCATRVRGAILDELRAQDWVPRLVRNRSTRYHRALTDLRRELGREPGAHEVAHRLGLPLTEAERMGREATLTAVYNLAPHDDREDDPRALRKLDILMDRDSELPFERLVARDLARALLGVLVGPERTVIALYYHESLTMKEIGRVMGISESRVCQIHTKTLKKLKGHLDRIGDRTREALADAG